MLLVVAIVVALPLVAAGGLAAMFWHSYSSNVQTLGGDPFPTDRVAAGADGSENILLLGSDTRLAELGDITSGTSTGQRSDTMLLVHIPADHQDVEVMSIMRDLWVPIPGHGEGKINAAFSYGGVPLAIQTVEQLLSTRIDHVAVIDFDGFAAMSTALGGVDVQSPKAFTSKNMRGYTFTAGTNHVEGQRALAFVRERYAFPDSDYQRVRNQQSFLEGVVAQVTSVDGPADIGTLNTFTATTSKYVAVDDGLDFQQLVKTGISLRKVHPGEIHFFTLPTAGTGTSPDGQSIVQVDQQAVSGIRSALQSDSLRTWMASNDLLNGN